MSVGFIGDSVTQYLVEYVAISACPSTEREITVDFIGVYVPQSLVVYVAKTACPSPA